MASSAKCPACGEPVAMPTCPSCGAALELGEGADDESAFERAQTVVDGDQTASDRDQTWSDRDQSSSDQDQRSADKDQLAADDDLTAGGDEAAHDRSTLARSRTTADRDAVSALRDEGATARLRSAAERDRAADRRDELAERRDADAHLRDLAAGGHEASPEEALSRAEIDRARAAADRARAAEDRARAAADREVASRERAEALRSRTQSADNLRRATTDELTGARTRKFGLEEMARELARAQRSNTTFVLAFIDVDGLKRINDTQGHLAGDALLKVVGETVHMHVRPYDIVVRYGGDELVCAMPGLSKAGAAERFTEIGRELKAVAAHYSISVGLAEARPGDDLETLLARADADLLESRRRETDAD
jgi:diguanylate cyclase (GGDEF)-like protein